MAHVTHSTSTHRAKLDPHEVESLSVYTMKEVERLRLLFLGPTGNVVFVGTTRGKLLDLIKSALRTFGPHRARQAIDDHIQNIVQVERERHKQNAPPLVASKRDRRPN